MVTYGVIRIVGDRTPRVPSNMRRFGPGIRLLKFWWQILGINSVWRSRLNCSIFVVPGEREAEVAHTHEV